MPRKLFEKGNKMAGSRKGIKNKKPEVELWGEALGQRLTKNDRIHIIDAALRHACGDVIITETADGEKLTSKCVSNPTLLLGITKMVAEAEIRKTPSRPAMPIIDGLRKELESYSKPSDTATA